MMTAKDFKAIAEIFRLRKRYCSTEADLSLDIVISELCEYFKTTNAKFDRERFLKACGVEE